MLCTQYGEIFEILEKAVHEPSGKIEDLWNLFTSTFPDKENIEEAERFDLYLYFLLNEEWREVSKAYLSLDSDLKREMMLRIADQMLTTQVESDT
ncbi:hypothetical protein D3C74_355270 [compost metagenome]